MARSVKNALLTIPFAQGMDQSVDERLCENGTLAVVENCRIERSALTKRPGFSAVGATVADNVVPPINGSSIYLTEKPSFLTSLGTTKLVGLTNGILYARDEEVSGTERWSAAGFFSTVQPIDRTDEVNFAIKVSVMPATAENSSGYKMLAYVFEDTATGRDFVCATIETAAGQRVFTYRAQAEAGDPDITTVRAFAIGTVFYLIWDDTTGIDMTTLTPTGSAVSGGTVTSLVSITGGGTWDAVPGVGSAVGSWYLAYINGAASGRIAVYTAAVSQSDAAISMPVGATNQAVSIYADATFSRLWIGVRQTDGALDTTLSIKLYSSAPAFMATVDIVTVPAAVGTLGVPLIGRDRVVAKQNSDSRSGVAYTYWNNALTAGDGSLGLRTMFGQLQDDTSVITVYSGRTVIAFGVLPVSKPDSYGRIWTVLSSDLAGTDALAVQRYVLISTNQYNDDSSLCRIELSTPNLPVGSVYAAQLARVGLWYAAPTEGVAANLMGLIEALGNDVERIGKYSYEPASIAQHRNATPAFGSIFTAGQPTQHYGAPLGFDKLTSGTAVPPAPGSAEVGFVGPPILAMATSVDASGDNRTGTRSYVAIFEWVDRIGQRHQSQPSIPVSLTIGAAGLFPSATVANFTATQRTDAISGRGLSVLFYSTVNGGTDYLFAGRGFIGTATDLSPTDDELADEGVVYTDGNVLPNTLGPTCRMSAATEDRLWCGGLWDRTIIQCSKIMVPGEPVQFTDSPAFQVVLPGRCTGISYLDGAVIAFTATSILQVAGDGPNDQGIGSFAVPRTLASSVGCIDERSIVRTEAGVFFQSKQGIYLLPRGLGPPQFVGERMHDDIEDYPTCLGAGLWVSRRYHLVRFLMATSGETNTDRVLTYDINADQWYRDTLQVANLGGDVSALGVWPDGFATALDSLAAANTSPFFYDNGEQTSDAGVFIPQDIDSAWIFPFDRGGWGMVRKVLLALEPLGTGQSLEITVQTDGIDGITSQAETFNSITNGSAVVYREVVLDKPHLGALRISIDTNAGADVSGGFRVLTCTLEAESDGGVRLLNTQTERA